MLPLRLLDHIAPGGEFIRVAKRHAALPVLEHAGAALAAFPAFVQISQFMSADRTLENGTQREIAYSVYTYSLVAAN